MSSFDTIDRHALSTPSGETRSLRRLAAWLGRPARNDLERARSVFRWVAENISYDVASYVTGRIPDQSPPNVLERRLAVCSGYATLFETLCRTSSVRVETIAGYAKGYGYLRLHDLSTPNHAWNAVKTDGRWKLLDVTWASGFVDKDQQFKRRFEDYFFLVDPERLIHTHYPQDPRWQLRKRRITHDQFRQLVMVSPAFYRAGLSLGNRRRSRMDVKKGAKLSFGCEPNSVVTAELTEGTTEVSGGTLIRYYQDHVEIRVAFPNPGSYVLSLFAKRSAEDTYEQALRYEIAARVGSGGARFPVTFADYTQARGRLQSPLQGDLRVGRTYDFRLHLPSAREVVVAAGVQTALGRAGESFRGRVTPTRPGKLLIVAKSRGSGKIGGLAEYTVGV